MNSDLKTIRSLIKGLFPDDAYILSDQLNAIEESPTSHNDILKREKAGKRICPYCHGSSVQKNGIKKANRLFTAEAAAGIFRIRPIPF